MSWAGKRILKDSFRSLFKKKEQAPSISSPTPRQALLPCTVERMDRLVRQWVDGKGYRMPDRTIAEAAARIGTDSSILYRYFQLRGEDFRSFRRRLRLEDAMEQMRTDPDSPVSLIGKRVGYLDRSNFSRQFKAYTGLTPEAWRQAQHTPAQSGQPTE